MQKINKKNKQVKRGFIPVIFEKIKNQWLQKRPVLFFILGFGVLVAVFYWFYESSYYTGIGALITAIDSNISNVLLHLMGEQSTISGPVISSPRFTISIERGCDAIEGMALFSAALIAYPSRWKHKLIGFFTGNVILFLLNLVRIVTLFLTGIYAPKLFQIMHIEIWEVIFILIAVALWILWIRWTIKDKGHVKN